MTKFLGMETGPTVGLSQHLADARSASRKLRAANDDYDDLLGDYNQLVERYNALDETHKLTKAALLAHYDQVSFIKQTSPDLPAFALTNQKYRSGNKKTVARLKMEEAMKEHGKKLGVALARILKFLDN